MARPKQGGQSQQLQLLQGGPLSPAAWAGEGRVFTLPHRASIRPPTNIILNTTQSAADAETKTHACAQPIQPT